MYIFMIFMGEKNVKNIMSICHRRDETHLFEQISLNPFLSERWIDVLENIKDAPKEDLPIMVKFVVNCTTAKEAALEIDTLR